MANEVKKFEEKTVDQVLAKVTAFQQAGELDLPKDYSASNALKSAWLVLQSLETKDKKPVLEACTRESIANTLFEMVVKGLNPAKKQCDFIPYCNKLTLQIEYHGTIALAKRFADVKEVNANVIYQNDIFEYAIDPVTARRSVVKHEQKLENIDDTKIRGAYAIVVFNDGTTDMTPMTVAQIKTAWNQGYTNGNSPAHKNFAGEMSKKTVCSRACKILISSSNDSVLIDEDKSLTISQEEILENANQEELEITPADIVVENTQSKPAEELMIEELAPVQEKKAPTIRSEQNKMTGPGF